MELNRCVDGMKNLVLANRAPCINLVLISLDVRAGFAGMSTALVGAANLARELDLPLRIIVLKDRPSSHLIIDQTTRDFLAEYFPNTASGLSSIFYLEDLADLAYSADDKWVVTFWMTAYALRELVDSNSVSASNVIYFIQDFEPGFYPFGTEYALASSTYDADFHWLINSVPLTEFFKQLGYSDHQNMVSFRPEIDRQKIRLASDLWKTEEDRFRIIFYGRPNHPRNMFELGIASLQLFIASLDSEDRRKVVIRSVGGFHEPIDLGFGVSMCSIGKLEIDDYFTLLSHTDLGLSLMQSPHPSHLALELPMAGIPTITNSYLRFRVPWVRDLHVTDPRPHLLAAKIGELFDSERLRVRHTFNDLSTESLGQSLSEATTEILVSSGWMKPSF